MFGLRYSSFYDVKSVSLSYGFKFDCITVIWQQIDAIQASIKSAINQICKYIQHWNRAAIYKFVQESQKVRRKKNETKNKRIKIHNFFNLWIEDNRHECKRKMYTNTHNGMRCWNYVIYNPIHSAIKTIQSDVCYSELWFLSESIFIFGREKVPKMIKQWMK